MSNIILLSNDIKKSEVFTINYNLNDPCFLQIEKMGSVEVMETHRTSSIDKELQATKAC